MVRSIRVPGLVLFLAVLCVRALPVSAQSPTPIRIAFIDPLSGAFSSSGVNALRQFQFAADTLVNAHGGVLGGRPLEIVPFDNKGTVQDSQTQLRRAQGEGISYVIQGASSAVASALLTSIDRHNRRNPDQRLLFLNYAAVDPVLTNANCSFWHFRFDAHTDLKMDALTDLIAARPEIQRVYVIGQDYSFGQAVGEAAVAMLARKRPELAVVGNELHPLESVKDFSPYVSKIVRSRADAIITGNWGADMASLARAINDAGLDIPIYTFYAAFDGITATLGAAGVDRIRLVHEGHFNPAPTARQAEYVRAFKARWPDQDFSFPRATLIIEMLARAIEAAGSDDPLAVALALEDMRHINIHGDEVYLRGADHQLFQPILVSVHTNQGIEFDGDNSGFGLRTEASVPLPQVLQDHQCVMARP